MRIRAVLRRAAPPSPAQTHITCGDLTLDRSKHQLRQNNQPIELTPLEFFILETLMQAPGQVIRRADFAARLLEQGFSGSEATLKIHIRNLRLKLNDDLQQPRYIETVFGIGYRFLDSSLDN